MQVIARLAATVGQLALAPLAGFVLAAAAAAFAWPSWAEDIHGDYYVVVASIIPVLLLALLLEVGASVPVQAIADRIHAAVDSGIQELDEIRPAIEGDAEAERKLLAIVDRLERIRETHIARMVPTVERLRWTVRGFFLSAVVGEAVSLYAVAAETTTPFTFILSAVQTLALVVVLVKAYELRFALD